MIFYPDPRVKKPPGAGCGSATITKQVSFVRLGKGVAKIFREKFGRIRELEDSGAEVGGIADLREAGRFIYNLVTKVS